MNSMASKLAVTAFLLAAAGRCFAQGGAATPPQAPHAMPAPAAPGAAGMTVFTSPKGFSISYPAGWSVASKDQTNGVANQARGYLDKLGPSGQVDLDHLAVMIYRQDGGNFAANLNINVTPGVLTANEKNKGEMSAMLTDMWHSVGVTPTNVRLGIESFAGKQCLVARYDAAMFGQQVSQMMVVVPGGHQSYITTCSSAPGDMAKNEPIFKSMIDSMTFDEGFAGLNPILRDALIGAGFGLLLGLAGPFLRALEGGNRR
jgi:hypothetical protein